MRTGRAASSTVEGNNGEGRAGLGRELTGPMLANFDQERDRLDGIMARKPARVAAR